MPVAAADRTAADLSATQLTPDKRIEGAKSASGRLAQTDPALLKRNDSALVAVAIKLDHDALASYAGGVKGLAATSPLATGKALTGASGAERAYLGHVKAREASVVKALKQIKGVTVGRAFRVVYGGLAARIPANAVERILKIPGVAAVQYNAVRQPVTDSSTDFIGADAAYARLGTTTNAGQGRIYANLDTGAWPEHPSFADQGNLPAPPARPGGGVRTCEFGDNPVTPAADVFVCNDKLIGGEAFLDDHNFFNPGETFPDTARDSDGHGTHTASTSAGNVLPSAVVLGVDRGPINGVAPGAHVMIYKVCGYGGCFSTDSAAAVEEAILDGVNVINFSVSGGVDPYTDMVELAFLDAYAAGVFVAASAGNDGPGSGTANHLSPWVTTVAASTQTREFATTLLMGNAQGDFEQFEGASITAGVGAAPVVLASSAPYSNTLCTAPAAPGIFAGKIVACRRGTIARVEKGYNVLQGGAVGMILYNATLQDVETDNHWLPTVHLPDGGPFLAFMASGTGEFSGWAAGEPRVGQGDVMAAFSSRGPGGNFIKPDVTAPGVQILAGHTPVPETITGGPPGQYFQAIAGTSMSAPHVAGAAVLVKAVHPTWTPGKIKSALMTTATRNVVKEDTVTQADPLDMGAGRIDVAAAIRAPLTLDESAARFLALGNAEISAVNLNLPSINANTVPGRLSTTRRVLNVSGVRRTFNAFTLDNATSRVSVSPSSFTLDPGKTQLLTIWIYADADTDVQQFASIELRSSGTVPQHMPVAFVKKQGSVSLIQTCDAREIYLEQATTCQVLATNNSYDDQVVDLDTRTNDRLWIRSASGATRVSGSHVMRHNVTLTGAEPGVPFLTNFGPIGGPNGYLALADFGITPDAVGDEDGLNYGVPDYVFNGVTFDTVGVTSNGYIVAGGVETADDIQFDPPDGTSPAPPNNVLAPFWTDLEGTDSPGIYAATLTDGTSDWLVFEWQVEVYGTEDLKVFQVWIGVNGEQDITYNYRPGINLDGVVPSPFNGLLIGAENEIGQGQMILDTAPANDYRVESTDPAPGQTVYYSLRVKGVKTGYGAVTTSMRATGVPGTTVVQTPIQVLAP